jgi:transglutaminase-like putative cysteine protease
VTQRPGPGTRRFRIVHRTSLTYTSPIAASHNELRMTPISEPGQTTLEHRLRIRPMTWSHVFQDYWGSQVTALDVSAGHERLDIDSLSIVERAPVPADDAPGLGWEELDTPTVADTHYEWLTIDGRTTPGSELTQQVRDQFRGRSVNDAVHSIFDLVGGHLDYRPGATAVHSSAEEAWAAGGGVCQDYSHVTVGLLRSLRVPARYVSGYLAPRQDSEVGETSSGESHAWVEWWDGSWHGFDPTNGKPVGLEHVVVGRGRDYGDVPPLVGVFSGAAQSQLEVDVQFTRLA